VDAVLHLAREAVVYGGRWPGRVVRSLLVLVVYLLAVVAATIGLVFVAILWR
jgi:hypothetical protein